MRVALLSSLLFLAAVVPGWPAPDGATNPGRLLPWS